MKAHLLLIVFVSSYTSFDSNSGLIYEITANAERNQQSPTPPYEISSAVNPFSKTIFSATGVPLSSFISSRFFQSAFFQLCPYQFYYDGPKKATFPVNCSSTNCPLNSESTILSHLDAYFENALSISDFEWNS
jgi:hypothetical protein